MDALYCKRICINGASGFVGQELCYFLQQQGFEISVIPRAMYYKTRELSAFISGSRAVINIAGAPIAGKRWTKSYKKLIYDSRINTTSALAAAIAESDIKPAQFISISAVGIYDNQHQHTEHSDNLAHDFLAKVCKDWENEARRAETLTCVSIVRSGIILGTRGGVLKKLQPLFRFCLGGTIGNGKQAFPFISISDFCRIISHIMQQQSKDIYNAVSPSMTTNKGFTHTLASNLKRPAMFIIPGFILRLMLGEGARFILEGQQVIPQRLSDEGFVFEKADIDLALK